MHQIASLWEWHIRRRYCFTNNVVHRARPQLLIVLGVLWYPQSLFSVTCFINNLFHRDLRQPHFVAYAKDMRKFRSLGSHLSCELTLEDLGRCHRTLHKGVWRVFSLLLCSVYSSSHTFCIHLRISYKLIAVIGADAIISCLRRLPPTRHHLTTFAIDVILNEFVIIFSVSGYFKESASNSLTNRYSFLMFSTCSHFSK